MVYVHWALSVSVAVVVIETFTFALRVVGLVCYRLAGLNRNFVHFDPQSYIRHLDLYSVISMLQILRIYSKFCIRVGSFNL